MSDQPAREESTEEAQETPTRKEPSSERPKRPRSSPSSDAGEKRSPSRPSSASAKRSTSARGETPPEGSGRVRRSEPSEQRSGTQLNARKAAATALEQLQELTTRTPESVVGVERFEDGWAVTIEVVESTRIPNTADIMAEYEVKLDGHGEMVSYPRGSRYSRGRARND